MNIKLINVFVLLQIQINDFLNTDLWIILFVLILEKFLLI